MEEKAIAVPSSEEVRAFNFPEIQKHVDEMLATLPPGARGTVMAYAVMENGKPALKLGGWAKLNDQWSFEGEFKQPYKGKLEGHVAVRFVF